MKLYKITAANLNDAHDNSVIWVGSKAEGVVARKGLADKGFSRKEITEVETDVPTDKAGLLGFLNGQAGA